MIDKIELNKIQTSIIRQLFINETLRFAQINTEDVSSDHFSYHLRQLVKNRIVEKDTDSLYSLSVIGRNQAIMLDDSENKIVKQGFLACLLVISKTTDTKKEYLMHERLRVPYKGSIALPGGKILFGENILDAAQRVMTEQTGLQAQLSLSGQVHYKDVYMGEIVQDKYFYVITASKVLGIPSVSSPTGKSVWMTLEKIKNSPKTLQGAYRMIEISQSKDYEFDEKTFTMTGY